MKNSRWLFQTLILSVALNLALIGVFFYFLIQDNPLHFSYRASEVVKQGEPPVPSTFLEKLPQVPFERLVALLEDERKLEQNGYKVCDVALSALAAYHDFAVERGLGRGKLSKQIWEQGENQFIIYPGLKKEDFQTLKNFAEKERWPFTTRGLFKKIQATPRDEINPELLTFFCHTPEFVLVETLLARTHLPIQKRTVLNLILESGIDSLENFAAIEEKAADFSDERRREFLMSSVASNSKTAAYLLLITDGAFAFNHCDDQQIAQILELLTVKTKESLQFAQAVAGSSRLPPLRDKALQRIADYMGTPQTEAGELTGHFVEKPGQKDLRPVFRQAPPAAPAPGSHVVQEGESLWMIAKKHQVSVEKLMEANQLQNAVIRPGKTLKIP